MPTEAAPESAYAWLRLAISVALSTIGGISLWSVVVVLPAVQTEFGVDRATASLPYTLAMVGFALGGVMMGRMADRWGIMWSTLIGAAALSAGYIAAAASTSLWQFALAHGVLVAFGGAATFGPMVADISHWFTRRRGIAVAIAASGNYLAGTAWPPLVQHYDQSIGLRQTLLGIGILCAVTMIPLALTLRRRPPVHVGTVTTSVSTASLGLSPGALQTTLVLAGFCCCVAMSMPQVHIVAYCGDLGYGITRGTEMLSLMLGLGIVSRVGSGFLADRLGGLPTLLIGSIGQMLALLLYIGFSTLYPLYAISALFGLVQGGIVPCYAIIVREYMPAREAGMRFGIVIMATLFGMAFGGWISGVIFDATGSYHAAFANGALWNLLNACIAVFLLSRARTARRWATA
ncbi:MAG TPA: MFS transporter [Acetobacteraceae bacterium]|nr:MFS transporter [Acetobacteraceae bacterium]